MGDGSDSGTPWDQSGPPHFFSKWPITKPKIFASFLWKIVHQNDQLVEGSSKLVFPRAGSLYVRISQSRDSLHNPGLCLHNPGIMETTHPQPPTTPLQLDEKNGMESEIFRLRLSPRIGGCHFGVGRCVPISYLKAVEISYSEKAQELLNKTISGF
jgi:hypothetical protein